jgi:hypothetical protein
MNMAASESTDYASFKAMQWDGWQHRAPHYHDRFGRQGDVEGFFVPTSEA